MRFLNQDVFPSPIHRAAALTAILILLAATALILPPKRPLQAMPRTRSLRSGLSPWRLK